MVFVRFILLLSLIIPCLQSNCGESNGAGKLFSQSTLDEVANAIGKRVFEYQQQRALEWRFNKQTIKKFLLETTSTLAVTVLVGGVLNFFLQKVLNSSDKKYQIKKAVLELFEQQDSYKVDHYFVQETIKSDVDNLIQSLNNKELQKIPNTLIIGQPGAGKNSLVYHIRQQSDSYLIPFSRLMAIVRRCEVQPIEIINVFNEYAKQQFEKTGKRTILFIDELDKILRDQATYNVFCLAFDGGVQDNSTPSVTMVAATNDPTSLNYETKRRFNRTVELPETFSIDDCVEFIVQTTPELTVNSQGKVNDKEAIKNHFVKINDALESLKTYCNTLGLKNTLVKWGTLKSEQPTIYENNKTTLERIEKGYQSKLEKIEKSYLPDGQDYSLDRGIQLANFIHMQRTFYNNFSEENLKKSLEKHHLKISNYTSFLEKRYEALCESTLKNIQNSIVLDGSEKNIRKYICNYIY